MTDVFIDNTAVGSNTGANWANAYNGGGNADWTSAFADAATAGDRIIVASDHLTTLTANFSATVNANHTRGDRLKIIVSSSAGGGTTVSPVSGYGAAGNGEVDCVSLWDWVISGNHVIHGLRLTSPDSMGLCGGLIGKGLTWEKCLILLDRTTQAEGYQMGNGASLDMVDTDLTLSGNNHSIDFVADGAGIRMHGGSIVTDSSIQQIFDISTGKSAVIEMVGVDCTGINSSTDLHSSPGLIERLNSIWKNCLWPATMPPLWGGTAANLSTISQIILSGPQFEVIAQYQAGNLLDETTIRRASGADTGSQTYSVKFESTSSSSRTNPLRHIFAVSNPGDLDTLTVKVHFANNQGALTNDQIWIECRAATSTGMENETDRNPLGASATTHTDESGSVDWRNGGSALTSYNEQSCEVTFSATTVGTLWVSICVGADFTTTNNLYIDPKFVIA